MFRLAVVSEVVARPWCFCIVQLVIQNIQIRIEDGFNFRWTSAVTHRVERSKYSTSLHDNNAVLVWA